MWRALIRSVWSCCSRANASLKLTRNTALLDPDGNPTEPRNLLPGARISATGTIATRGRRSTHVVETLQILSGRPFELQARVESVDGRVLTLLPRSPEPIDPRAKFADARGRRVSREEFEGLLADAQGLDVLLKLNRFGTGIVGLQIYDPNRNREIKEDERLVSASVITIEPTDAGFLVVFAARPPVTVADDAVIRGDDDAAADLAALVDKRVILAGEVIDGVRVADRVFVIRTLDRIDVQITVGDFDGEGVENDAEVRVFDPDGGELETSFQVSLDRERPVEAFSGDTKLNLRPGKHRIVVRIPELQGLAGRAEFLIRDRGPGLEVVEVFPADGDVDVTESNEISIAFNSPIRQTGRFVNVTAVLRPGGRLRDIVLSDDGQTVFIPVELDPQTTYTLAIVRAVGVNRQALRRPVVVTFSTGGEVQVPAEISGTVALVARAKQADPIEILAGEVIAGDADRREAGRGRVETDGTFLLEGLPAGTYRLFVNLETSIGRASGFFDGDLDGAPDDVTVASGDAISGIAVSVLEPLVFEEPEPSEDPVVVVDSPVGVDLDATVGDQMLDFVAGEPGGEVSVAVYAEGVENLLGFDLLVEFDPTAVSFIEVLEDNGEEELNLLKLNGGYALGIPNPGASSLNWSVVILGGTDEQLAQGDGLLGVFRFEVNESFFGTTDITVSQLVQESSTGSSIVQPFVAAQIDGEGVTKQIIVSTESESIAADGGQTTISVSLTDLDGISFTDDDASTVTIQVVDGDATVDDATEVELTVSGGAASVVLAAQGSGTIQVAVSTEGASSQIITIEAPGLGEGAVGPIALDADLASGDQEDRVLPGSFAVGDQVVVDVVAVSGANGIIGFQVQLVYDPLALSFVDFLPTDLMAAGLPLPREESDSVIEINVAILGGQTTSDAGSFGQATFEILEGFSESTLIEIVSAVYDEDVLSVGFGGAVVQIGGSGGAGSTADFDGDGTIGFGDFVQFAGVFGLSTGAEGFDVRFDLA